MVGRLGTPPGASEGSGWQEQKVGAWLSLLLPGSLQGPRLTICTDQKPHEDVESPGSWHLLLRKGLGVAEGSSASLACK